MHGVSSSIHKPTASSRYFQFHWFDIRDSGTVVIPFMQVGTYPTRNFATLGPLWLQPPFTEVYSQCFHILNYHLSTGQVSDPIHHFTILQSPVFLINSRYPQFYAIKKNFNTCSSKVTRSICRIPLISINHTS